MSYKRKNLSTVLASIIGVMAVAAVAIWQFYVFATFRDSTGVIDKQGGILHLFMALAAGLIACIAGFLVFSYFLRYDSEDDLHITSQGAP